MFFWKTNRFTAFNESTTLLNVKFEMNFVKKSIKHLLTLVLVVLMLSSIVSIVNPQSSPTMTASQTHDQHSIPNSISSSDFPMFDPNSFNNPTYSDPIQINSPLIHIQKNADFSNLNIQGEGTANNPFLIENLQIVESMNTILQIEDTSAHVIVQNNVFDGNFISTGGYQFGIYIKNAHNIVIKDNYITNVNYGIVIDDSSSNNLIKDNTIKNVDYGLIVLRESTNNEISNNKFQNIVYYGIYFTGITNNFILSENVVRNNEIKVAKTGIYAVSVEKTVFQSNIIQAYDYGIILDSSSNNLIDSNDISESSIGILIDSLLGLEKESVSNLIIYNNFENINYNGLVLGTNVNTYVKENTFNNIRDYAIYSYSEDSIGLVVERNSFIDNNIGGSQAFDSSQDSSFEENFWSNYDGYGTYQIDGLSSNTDFSPMAKGGGGPHQIFKPEMIFPTGGETLSGIERVRWSDSFDNKGHQVFYSLYFQNEKEPDESAWLLVANGLTTTYYDWDTTEIENDLYRIFVRAYDPYGVEAMGDHSNYFEIYNNEHTLTTPTILYPNGGETLNGKVSVDWLDSVDSLGHQVFYNVYLTSDNGTNWENLVTNLTDSQYELSTRYLFPFTDYKLKIVANDYHGLNTSDETDYAFIIDNNFPGYYYFNSDYDFYGYRIPGKGLVTFPYLLSDQTYDHPDISFVFVEQTTKYFSISNNDLSVDNGVPNVIDIRDTQFITVTGNNITSGGNGVYVENSHNITISDNNIFSNTLNGVYVTATTDSLIFNNVIHDNAGNGIFVENSVSIIVSTNEIYDNGKGTLARLSIAGVSSIGSLSASFGAGIFLDPTNDSFVINNIVYNNALDGVNLELTDSTNVQGNLLYGNGLNGLTLINSSDNSLIGNTIFNNGFSFVGQTSSYGRFNIRGLTASFGAGIFLDPSNNNLLQNNEIYNNVENGISLEGSGYNTISDNIVYRNGVGSPATASIESLSASFGAGIFLDPSNYNNISNNIAFENGMEGISLLESDYTLIENNSIYLNNLNGLTLINSNYNNMTNNYVFDNGFGGNSFGIAEISELTASFGAGIFLDPSENNIINGNYIYNNAEHGMSFENSDDNKITNNVIFRNGIGSVSTAGISSLSASFGAGIFLDPSENNEISNNYIFENGLNGVELLDSNYTTIRNNSIYDNGNNGLAFLNSSYGFIIDNFIFNNGIGSASTAGTTSLSASFGAGIFLDPSEGHIIEGNEINSNGFSGIYLDYTSNSYINNNTINNNGDNGVFFFFSNSNYLTRNYIQDNGNGTIINHISSLFKVTKLSASFGAGIFLDPSHDNVITDNVIVRNGGYGLDIDVNSSINSVTRNDFIENSDFSGNAQTRDDGVFNAFTGNYYSDGQGSSQPYDIDGNSENQDTTPLDFPTYFPRHELSEPTVLFPNGGETLKGEITILWNVSIDSWDHEVTYEIWWSFDNGVKFAQIATGVTETSYTVDSLTVLHDGQNNLFKIISTDGRGNFAEDTSDDRFTIKNPGSKNRNLFLFLSENTTEAVSNLVGISPVFVVFSLPIIVGIKKIKTKK